MTRRTERVSQRIKQELAIAIQGLRNPDVGFVTVTKVEVSPDLRNAKVYVSVLPTKEVSDPDKCIWALQHSAGYLQGCIAGALKSKATPELKFYEDRSLVISQNMNKLIEEARATDSDHAADGTPEDADTRDE
jgi:ribosome-binding factor A